MSHRLLTILAIRPYKIILVSHSPRRQELLRGLDMSFEVKVKEGIPEDYPADLDTIEIPKFIAQKKAAAYEMVQDELLIATDTVVVLGRHVMGKPADADHARHMLRELSGKTHQVVTGVCLKTTLGQRAFSVVTNVAFKELSDAEIDYYIEKYQPLDEAGVHGIQEWIGYIGVTKLEGSYFSVMGLPVQRIYEELNKVK